MTTIRKTLTPYVAPKGKKFNNPCSLGIPKIKVQVECPICSVYNKDGTVCKGVLKESPSAPMCKKCHDKMIDENKKVV